MQYGLPVFGVVGVTLLKLRLPVVGAPTPFLLYFLLVVVVAMLGGPISGMLAAVLSGLAANIFFLGSAVGKPSLDLQSVVQTLIFIVEGALVALLTNFELHFRYKSGKSEAERQQIYEALMQVPAAVATLRGPKHVFELANETYMKLVAGPRNIIGLPVAEALPEVVEQGFVDLLDNVYSTGKPYVGNEVIVRLDHDNTGKLEEVLFNFIYLPTRDTTGQIDGILVHAVDITVLVLARKRLEKLNAKLRESEKEIYAQRQRLYELFMNSPAMVALVHGPNHVYELANEKYMKVIAGSRDIIGLPVAEALPGAKPDANKQQIIDLLDKVYRNGEPFIGEELLIKVDRHGTGELVDCYRDLTYQPTRNAQGEVDGVFIHAFDVTNQVLARKQVEEATNRLTRSQEAGNIASFELDLATGVTQGTPKLAELLGVPVDKIGGLYGNQSGRIHPEDLARIKDLRAEAQRSHQPFSADYRAIWPDKSEHWVAATAKFEYGADGKATRMVGAIMDISERKALERQKDDFIAVASHELKTPVTSIKTLAQIMERRFAKNHQTDEADNMQRITAQLEKLAELIGDLLDVTRIDSGKIQMQLEPIDFDKLVAEAVEQARLTTDRHDITVHGSTGTQVTCDRDRIGQVFTNLLSNAIKYSPNSREIQVKLSAHGGHVTACVVDHGIGIDKNRLEAVFGRFSRSKDPKLQSFPGLGLGLYISAQIVHDHGGRIWAESKAGQGSMFWVELPIHQSGGGTHE